MIIFQYHSEVIYLLCVVKIASLNNLRINQSGKINSKYNFVILFYLVIMNTYSQCELEAGDKVLQSKLLRKKTRMWILFLSDSIMLM